MHVLSGDELSCSDSEFYESDSDLGDSEYGIITPRNSAHMTNFSVSSVTAGLTGSINGMLGGASKHHSHSHNNSHHHSTGLSIDSSVPVGIQGPMLSPQPTAPSMAEFHGKMTTDAGISTTTLNENRYVNQSASSTTPPSSSSPSLSVSRNLASSQSQSVPVRGSLTTNYSNNSYRTSSILGNLFQSITSNSSGVNNSVNGSRNPSPKVHIPSAFSSTNPSFRSSVNQCNSEDGPSTTIDSMEQTQKQPSDNNLDKSESGIRPNRFSMSSLFAGPSLRVRTNSLFSSTPAATGGAVGSSEATTPSAAARNHPMLRLTSAGQPRHPYQRPWTHRVSFSITVCVCVLRERVCVCYVLIYFG